MGGSEQTVRDKIKRSLLIEQVLKSDVEDKDTVTLTELRAYYDKNPAKFQVPESFTFQSISIMPPQKASAAQQSEGLKRANDALIQAKATKTHQEFGLLAEKISEDDFRVNMGDHKAVEKDKLPPQVVKALVHDEARPSERRDSDRAGVHDHPVERAYARQEAKL